MGWLSKLKYTHTLTQTEYAKSMSTDRLIKATTNGFRDATPNNNIAALTTTTASHVTPHINYQAGTNVLSQRKLENNDEIKRISALEANGLATPADKAEKARLIKQNARIKAVMNLGNTYSNAAATQANTAPTQGNPAASQQNTAPTQSNPPAGQTNTAPTQGNPAADQTNAAPANSSSESSQVPRPPGESFAAANKEIQNSNDEARWAYMGTESSAAFSNLEETADKLKAAMTSGAGAKEIQEIAKSLNEQIDQLQAKLSQEGDTGKAALAFLVKAGESVDTLIQDTGKVINSPASKLSDAIDTIPESYKNTANYKELTALNKELEAAIRDGKDTKGIAKKINAAVDKWQAELAANPITSQDTKTTKDRADLEVALKNIEASVSNVIRPDSGDSVEKPDQITIDRKNNIINIDSNQDGKIDYQIKMEGKRRAWEVTKMGADGKPENSFRVWGDPHVDLDSDKSKGNKTDFNFFEDATFVLEGVDGGPNIKITVDTARKDGKEEGSGYTQGDVSYSSGLTITTGDAAIKVSGIDDNKVVIGDVTGDGQKIDDDTNDGTVFIVNDDLSSMDVINEGGRSSISNGNVPMYSTSFYQHEYNEENAFSDEEAEAEAS